MNDLSATAALYSARPSIAIDGENASDLADAVVTLSVHESDAGMYRAEISFVNWGDHRGEVGFLFFDRQRLDFGKQLAISMGDGETASEIFFGAVTGIEGRFLRNRPPELLILAEDRLQNLRMVRRTRTFDDVSLDDVAQAIASDHGLASDIDVDGPTHRVLTQLNQSDLAFLRERARAQDAEVWVEHDTLKVQARSRRNSGAVSMRYQQRLKEFSVLADLAHQRTDMVVGGWDTGAKEAIEAHARSSAIRSELNGLTSGSSILSDRFGERPETVIHLMPGSTEEAESLADTYYRQTARRFVRGRGVAEGDGRVRAGAEVTLEGIGGLFNGSYYVSEVHHQFTLQQGYQTYFTAERPGLGEE